MPVGVLVGRCLEWRGRSLESRLQTCGVVRWWRASCSMVCSGHGTKAVSQCLENKAAKGVQCRVDDLEAVTVTQALRLGGDMVCSQKTLFGAPASPSTYRDTVLYVTASLTGQMVYHSYRHKHRYHERLEVLNLLKLK